MARERIMLYVEFLIRRDLMRVAQTSILVITPMGAIPTNSNSNITLMLYLGEGTKWPAPVGTK